MLKYPVLYLYLQNELVEIANRAGYFTLRDANKFLPRSHNLPKALIPSILMDMKSYGLLSKPNKKDFRVLTNKYTGIAKDYSKINHFVGLW